MLPVTLLLLDRTRPSDIKTETDGFDQLSESEIPTRPTCSTEERKQYLRHMGQLFCRVNLVSYCNKIVYVLFLDASATSDVVLC